MRVSISNVGGLFGLARALNDRNYAEASLAPVPIERLDGFEHEPVYRPTIKRQNLTLLRTFKPCRGVRRFRFA